MNFTRFAAIVADKLGKPTTFFINLFLLLAWLVGGPFFHWSDNYMLVGNSFMSAVAFLAVFILQHTQNRDSIAIHSKLDEIIKALDEADDKLIGIEKEL